MFEENKIHGFVVASVPNIFIETTGFWNCANICMSVANGECFCDGVGIWRAKAQMATFDSYFCVMLLRWYICVLKMPTLFSVPSAHKPHPTDPVVQSL